MSQAGQGPDRPRARPINPIEPFDPLLQERRIARLIVRALLTGLRRCARRTGQSAVPLPPRTMRSAGLTRHPYTAPTLPADRIANVRVRRRRLASEMKVL